MINDEIEHSQRPDVFKHFAIWSLGAGIPIAVGYALLSSFLVATLSGTGDFRVGENLTMVVLTIPLLVGVGLLHAYILNKILVQHYHFMVFSKTPTHPFSLQSLKYYRWRVAIILFPISYLIVIVLFLIDILFLSELTYAFFVIGLNLGVPMSVIYVIAAIRYLGILHRHDLEVYPEYKEKKKKRTELS